MFRLSVIGAGTLLVAGIASAANIQLGGASGLTYSYITTGCSNNDGSGTGCVTGGESGVVAERNYDGRLFSNATENFATMEPYTTTSAPGDTNYQPYGGNTSGNILNDSTNTVSFSMISDGCTPGAGAPVTCSGSGTGTDNQSADFYQFSSAGSVVTIPVGVLNVSNVWTMLENTNGLANVANTQVEFDFGATYNATTGLDKVILKLTNSGGGTSSGQLQSALDCTTPTACTTTYASGTPLASSPVTVDGSSTGTLLPASVTVTTNNLYSSLYNMVAAGNFVGSSGSAILDDQGFSFGTLYSGDYLVAIKVSELTGGSNSGTALSAVTVTSFATATPEPSTVLLFLAGFGAIGFCRLRCMRQA